MPGPRWGRLRTAVGRPQVPGRVGSAGRWPRFGIRSGAVGLSDCRDLLRFVGSAGAGPVRSSGVRPVAGQGCRRFGSVGCGADAVLVVMQGWPEAIVGVVRDRNRWVSRANGSWTGSGSFGLFRLPILRLQVFRPSGLGGCRHRDGAHLGRSLRIAAVRRGPVSCAGIGEANPYGGIPIWEYRCRLRRFPDRCGSNLLFSASVSE